MESWPSQNLLLKKRSKSISLHPLEILLNMVLKLIYTGVKSCLQRMLWPELMAASLSFFFSWSHWAGNDWNQTSSHIEFYVFYGIIFGARQVSLNFFYFVSLTTDPTFYPLSNIALLVVYHNESLESMGSGVSFFQIKILCVCNRYKERCRVVFMGCRTG